jgi:hypothetical protein
LVGGLEVPEFGDDVEAVVDGVAASAALPQYLAVAEPGHDLLDVSPDSVVHPVGVAGMVRPEWSRGGVLIEVMPG